MGEDAAQQVVLRPNSRWVQVEAKAFLDTRDELAQLGQQWTHALAKRDQAAIELQPTVLGVILAVGGDPAETQNGELYSAMGYVPRNQRGSGLVRPTTVAKRAEGGEGS